MALRLIQDNPELTPGVGRRLSDGAVFVWGVIWTIVTSAALIVFWVEAMPVRELFWTAVVFICSIASSTLVIAISKIDAILVLGPGAAVLFLAAQSTSGAEALAVWGTAYLIGAALSIREWSETAETVAYLLGSGLAAVTVLSWLHDAQAPWPICAVVFVSVYVIVRIAISVIRLLVVTRLSLAEIIGHLLVLRLLAAWVAIMLVAFAGELVRQAIGALHPSIDLYWGGAIVILMMGLSALTVSRYQEIQQISRQLAGTLAAANALPWEAEIGIKRHAVDFARLAFPAYAIGVQDRDERNVNEIISSLGDDGYLVARRGTAQRPFLVQDQSVLDAIAHIAVTMAATYQERETLALSAITDDLTNLPNYRGFREFLSHTAETAEEGFAVVYVDIDRFKEVNDRHGHEAGNTVLRSLAARLRSRQGPQDLVARIGGDEFVLVLTGIASEEEAKRRAQELLLASSAPIMLGDTLIALSLSSGIAFARPGDVEVSSLVEAADARMYAARGRQIIADPAELAEVGGAQDVNELTGAIQSAIHERRLSVMYQPIVDAVDDRIVSFEALIRPDECELVGIPADIIVHEAKRLGLLTELSIHVIETAVRDLGRFRELAPELDKVNVNVDVEQVTDPAFLDVMTRPGGPDCGARVALELSESSLNRSSADLHRELDRLRGEYGVPIALDDFGRQSSTLLSLLQYPVDILKIDKALADDMHLSKQQTVMRSMVTLAQNLRVRMVVEGVEDDATRDELIRLGVRYMQGYRFGAALTADEMLDRIAGHGLQARLP